MDSDKFPNVPWQLRNEVRHMPVELRNPKFRYGAAAGLVVRHYLGKAFASAPGSLLPREGGWKLSARVSEVGQNIFRLRCEPGFGEIRRRMREGGRDLQSVHRELASAMTLKHLGFTIYARRETQVKGEDFDFWAIKDDVRVNCEVTYLRGENFSPNNVLNALRKKRSQLPTGAPALIVCYWPADRWTEGRPEMLERDLRGIADQFFAGTQRINFVLFSREVLISRPGGGAIVFSSQICRHPHPREDAAVLDKAFSTPPANHDAIKRALASGTERPPPSGEFVHWVDHVLDG